MREQLQNPTAYATIYDTKTQLYEKSVAMNALILRPFNGVYFAVFAAFTAICLILSLIMRRCSDKTRRATLAGLMLFTLALFVWYKIMLARDAEYSAITAAAGKGAFSWWGELPFQLCNINMILIPVAVLTKKRPLMGFCFFLGPLGAAMALFMPGIGFENYSILLPRMIGYFFTHFMVFFGGVALWSFGIYRPAFRDLPGVVLSVVALSLLVFAFNMILRLTGTYPNANYFFNVETEGNPVLEIFHRWLPYPFLFSLPSLLILIPYMLLITALFQIRGKKK